METHMFPGYLTLSLAISRDHGRWIRIFRVAHQSRVGGRAYGPFGCSQIHVVSPAGALNGGFIFPRIGGDGIDRLLSARSGAILHLI